MSEAQGPDHGSKPRVPLKRQETPATSEPPTLDFLANEVRKLREEVADVSSYLDLAPDSPLSQDATLRDARRHRAAKRAIREIRNRQAERRALIGDRFRLGGLEMAKASSEKPNPAAVALLKTAYVGTAVAIGTLAGYEAIQAAASLGDLGDRVSELSGAFSHVDKLVPVVEGTPQFPFFSIKAPDVGSYAQGISNGFTGLQEKGQELASHIKGSTVTSLGTVATLWLTRPWHAIATRSSLFGPALSKPISGIGNALNATGIEEASLQRGAHNLINRVKESLTK